MGESSGTTATDSMGLSNGTYARDISTMGTVAGKDGNTAPVFTPGSDAVDFYSSAFNSAFSGAAGSFGGLALIASGVWADGTLRTLGQILVDDNNYVRVDKLNSTANRMKFSYFSGGTPNYIIQTSFSQTTWFHWMITWDSVADEAKAYLNGTQVGSTMTGLGTWAGSLGSTTCVLGDANSSSFAAPFSGSLQYCAVWDKALTPARVAGLAVYPL